MVAAKSLFLFALKALSKIDTSDVPISKIITTMKAISLRAHEFDEQSRTSFVHFLGLVARSCRNSGLNLFDTDEMEFLANVFRTGSFEQKIFVSRAFFDLAKGGDLLLQALYSIGILQLYLCPEILFHSDYSLVQPVMNTLVRLARGTNQMKSALLESGAVKYMLLLIKDSKSIHQQKIKYFAAKVLWKLISDEEFLQIIVQSRDVLFSSLSPAVSEGSASSIALVNAILLKLSLSDHDSFSQIFSLYRNVRIFTSLLQLQTHLVAYTVEFLKMFSAAAKQTRWHLGGDSIFVYIADITVLPPCSLRAATELAEIFYSLFPH